MRTSADLSRSSFVRQSAHLALPTVTFKEAIWYTNDPVDIIALQRDMLLKNFKLDMKLDSKYS